MIRLITVTSPFIVFIFFLSAQSCVAASLKIGIIDTQEVVKKSKAAKDARDLLLKDLAEKQALYQQKQKDVVKINEELRKNENLDESARREKSDRLAQELKNLKRLKVDLEEELNKRNVQLTQKILKEILEIVQEFSRAKKYTIIMETKSVVTFDQAIDITGEIIKIYDTKKKK